MSQFFQFETDFATTLRCIPMTVRYKLDRCGVKLKLHHWNHLTADERTTLLNAHCSTEAESQAYRLLLHQFVQSHLGEFPADLPIESHPAWADPATIPESVKEQGSSLGIALTSDQWAGLTSLQRFVLIKLSRSTHENANFLPALREFHLI
jgi:hypothetical protein